MVRRDESDGKIIPSGMGRWQEPTPFELFVVEEVMRRADHRARPEVVERRLLEAQAAEQKRLAKLGTGAKGAGVYGPPDPRKGRPPMKR